LEPEAKISHAGEMGSSPAFAAAEMDVLALGTSGIWRYQLDPPQTIEPLAALFEDYSPDGCGRFGGRYSGGVSYDHRFTYANIRVYDQSNPLSPVYVTMEGAGWGQGGFGSVGIGGLHEHWAIIKKIEYTGEVWGDPFRKTGQVIAVDPEGHRHNCISIPSTHLYCAVEADILWTIYDEEDWLEGREFAEAFDLSGDVPVSYGVQPIRDARQFCVFGNLLLIVKPSGQPYGLDIYDAANPSNVRYLNSIATPVEIRELIPSSDAGLILATTPDGIALLTPHGTASSMVRGHLSLGRVQTSVACRGDLVAVADNQFWRLISIVDPDAPVVVGEFDTARVSGFTWSGDYLYVGMRGGLYLYDVADPASPVFIGQAGGQTPNGGPCARDLYIMHGPNVFLRDCADPLSTEGDRPEGEELGELPDAVVLHAVAPNPFNPRMTVTFDLARAERVKITVHDLRGRCVATLVDAQAVAGRQAVTWTGVDERGDPLASGTYLVRLATPSAVRSVKAVLVR